MTQGFPSDAADDAVQANITSTGHSNLPAGPAVVHDGYTSVYTVRCGGVPGAARSALTVKE
jgi:hypothetical protein